jgi:hypothetical protein
VKEEVMIDIVALASLCKLAIEGGLEEYKRRKLSEAEKELLIAAAKDGEFQVIHVNEAPDWIRVGRKNFPEDIAGDPAIAAMYEDAFTSLCKRAYIKHDHGILFRLTHTGFQKARQLASKIDKKKANKH